METHTFDIDGVLKEAKERAVAILIDSDVTLQESLSEVQRARELASRAGLSVESCIVKPKESVASDGFNQTTDLANTSKFTGGHSNTDHVVLKTGDYRVDRIAELKRNLLRRHRNMQPEERGEDRWDKPKIPGERRRRIVRVQDRDICYPQEPPITGWYVRLSMFLFVWFAQRCRNVIHRFESNLSLPMCISFFFFKGCIHSSNDYKNSSRSTG